MRKYNILFVCHGNICRSPMAEFIFKDLAAKKGLSQNCFACSAATSSEEIGNPVYPPAAAELKRNGIVGFGSKRAVKLKKSDYDDYDLIIGMDRENMYNMRRLFDGDPEDKLRLLMDFTPIRGEVSDPWYTGDFKRAFNDIYAGVSGLFDFLSISVIRKTD